MDVYLHEDLGRHKGRVETNLKEKLVEFISVGLIQHKDTVGIHSEFTRELLEEVIEGGWCASKLGLGPEYPGLAE
jgi:hypothetical protein